MLAVKVQLGQLPNHPVGQNPIHIGQRHVLAVPLFSLAICPVRQLDWHGGFVDCNDMLLSRTADVFIEIESENAEFTKQCSRLQ